MLIVCWLTLFPWLFKLFSFSWTTYFVHVIAFNILAHKHKGIKNLDFLFLRKKSFTVNHCLGSITHWLFVYEMLSCKERGYDSFHLCLFDFPFIYQFYSMMNTLVKLTCWNPTDLFIFKSFHQHFKNFDKVCYLKEKYSFRSSLFCSTVKWYLKW